MNKKPTTWPSPSYYVGTDSFVHAIGILSANYNLLEFQLMRLFKVYTINHPIASTLLFNSINNHNRLTIIKIIAPDSSHPLRVRNRVVEFCKGFNGCATNRNILMHSQMIPIIQDDGTYEVQFKKMPNKPPFEENIYAPSIDELRAIADAVKRFEQFGHKLFMHIVQEFERSLLTPELALLPPFKLPRNPQRPQILNPITP